jgi:HEAT repeat protein
VRAAAAGALGNIGAAAEAAIPELIRLFTDEEPTRFQRPVWLIAATATGELGQAAVPKLIAALDDPAFAVQRAALVGLARADSASVPALPRIIELLSSANRELQHNAIYALGAIGTEAALQPLIGKLSDQDFNTQCHACRALGEMGADAASAGPHLIELSKAGVASARRNAVAALGQIGPSIGDEGITRLAEALQDPHQAVREEAAHALGKLGAEAAAAAPALVAALDDPTFAPRVEASWALWRTSGEAETSVAVLIAQLEDFNDADTAAWVLGEIGPQAKPAIPALVELLASDDEGERLHAVQALGKIGQGSPDVEAALEKCLQDEAESVRTAADQALQAIRNPQPAPK